MDKIQFLRDLVSGKLGVGEQEISPESFEHWLKNKGYSEFRCRSWEEMKNKYAAAGRPLNTKQDFEAMIERMKIHKDGRLILAKAITEMFYGDISEDEKWELYQQGKKTGHCPLCGWRDGDGIKTCYYSRETGATTHENSWEWVLSQMTPSQKSLQESYGSIVTGVMDENTCNDLHRHLITKVTLEEDELRPISKKKEWRIGATVWDTDKYKTPEEVAEAWIGAKRSLERYLAKGYVIRREYTEEPREKTVFYEFKSFKRYDMQKPHTCGGFGSFLGPYHVGCTKCPEEVKLWEFGIDYDIG